ncbi:MAG: ATP phosphoribosyltransferase [Hyphomonadaceae bacterium]
MTALRLAIPSKGRLKEQAETYFADAGLRLRQLGGSRGYSATMEGAPDIEVRLLSAGEIAAGVASGEVHAGVTGEDLLRELSPDLEGLHLVMPLGFGKARLVVAAPKSWIDVETMADLDDVAARYEQREGRRMRVATKYTRQTERFFTEQGVGHYRIVESAGATEGAPAAGAAEIVVDITTTGATLEGNGLKIVRDGVILSSEAQLVVSMTADWSADARRALERLVRSLEARAAGRASQSLRFDAGFDPAKLAGDLRARLEVVGNGEAICSNADAASLAMEISAQGGGPVRVTSEDFIFRAHSERVETFYRALFGTDAS